MTARDKAQAPSWLAGAGTLLSLAACYGTLGLIALLSALGFTIAVNNHVWAAAIVAFALLAVLGVALGGMKHRKTGPLFLAITGAALVTWAMYGSQNITALLGVSGRVVELAGFAALISATVWDWRLKR